MAAYFKWASYQQHYWLRICLRPRIEHGRLQQEKGTRFYLRWNLLNLLYVPYVYFALSRATLLYLTALLKLFYFSTQPLSPFLYLTAATDFFFIPRSVNGSLYSNKYATAQFIRDLLNLITRGHFFDLFIIVYTIYSSVWFNYNKIILFLL